MRGGGEDISRRGKWRDEPREWEKKIHVNGKTRGREEDIGGRGKGRDESSEKGRRNVDRELERRT